MLILYIFDFLRFYVQKIGINIANILYIGYVCRNNAGLYDTAKVSINQIIIL